MNTATEFNLIGPAAALVAFLSIWMGHAAVRKIEYVSPILWPPAAGFSIMGLALIGLSLWTPARLTSLILGILGITLLWDTLELVRQAERVFKGRAPANPRNPRHSSLLKDTAMQPPSRERS